jgi:hypothetical protein
MLGSRVAKQKFKPIFESESNTESIFFEFSASLLRCVNSLMKDWIAARVTCDRRFFVWGRFHETVSAEIYG